MPLFGIRYTDVNVADRVLFAGTRPEQGEVKEEN